MQFIKKLKIKTVLVQGCKATTRIGLKKKKKPKADEKCKQKPLEV